MSNMERERERALKKAARRKIIEVERALTTGDLDTRKARVKAALEAQPRVSPARTSPEPASGADDDGSGGDAE